jgi:lipid II:glycine glycyltransferase (peptidoglycan interpeptide bridge formation enzyme)
VHLDALGSRGELVRRGATVAVDLTRPMESLWNGFRSNHRRQIRSAARDGLQVRFDDWSYLDQFIDCYYENMRYVNAGPEYFFNDRYFRRLHQLLGETTHLITAHHQGALIGGGIFFEHGGVVQYHLGATYNRHRDKHPTKSVIHDVIRWSKERGNRVLHLGGGIGGRADSLFHFKAGFSTSHCPFYTWHIVVDPGSYADLVASRPTGADPSFFPAYRLGAP